MAKQQSEPFTASAKLHQMPTEPMHIADAPASTPRGVFEPSIILLSDSEDDVGTSANLEPAPKSDPVPPSIVRRSTRLHSKSAPQTSRSRKSSASTQGVKRGILKAIRTDASKLKFKKKRLDADPKAVLPVTNTKHREAFYLANRSTFLPLLPSRNLITKLSMNAQRLTNSISPYVEFKAQPAG